MAWAQVVLQTAADVDIGHIQDREDFDGGGAAPHGRQVVISHQQKAGNPRPGQPRQPFGKLALVGLGGIAALVGITRQQHQVRFRANSTTWSKELRKSPNLVESPVSGSMRP